MSDYSALHCSRCAKPAACCRQGFALRAFDPAWPLADDGSCAHLDPATNRCTIYATRPTICNVDDMKPDWFTVEEWYALNAEACAVLVAT